MSRNFFNAKNNNFFEKNPDAICYSLLLLIAVALYLTAPKNGDFWWSEAPRNALNGAFVLDFIKAMPLHDPVEWAQRYYYQYPSLTILFYPPMLHVFLAAFYFIFGVSHSSAVACLSVFSFFLGIGIYKLAGRIVSRPSALAASILFFSAPEIVIWAQQIMLEIPMMAFSVWSAYFLLKYGDSEKWQDLLKSALLISAALYTKQTAGVIALALVIAFISSHGVKKFAVRRHVAIIVLLSILGLVPLAIIQFKFAAFNVVSVVNRADIKMDRLSLENIFWYLMHLPKMSGWGLFFLSFCGFAGFFVNRDLSKKTDYLIHICWFVIGYIAMTAIHLKETRHGTFLLIPLAIAAAIFLDRLLTAPYQRLASPVIAASLFIATLLNNPTPGIDGYNKASDLIATLAPARGRVLFAGNQDGNFIFNLRQKENRRDISVIRADKLFLNIAIMPDLGLNPKNLSIEQVSQTINRLGISYVVTVPHVWSEAKPMAYLAQILDSDGFHEVSRLAVTGSHSEHELVIYKNLNPLPANPVGFDMDLPAIGISLKGTKE